MKRIVFTTLAGVALLMLAPTTALAHVDVHFDVGLPLYVDPPAVYYEPPERYYTPPPPVYYGPRVIYRDQDRDYEDRDYQDYDRRNHDRGRHRGQRHHHDDE